jgi:hypothetical protein
VNTARRRRGSGADAACLIVEADAGTAGERHRRHERGVEPQFTGERGFARNSSPRRRLRVDRARADSLHPLEAAVDLVLAGDLVDLRDRGAPGVPHGLRVRAAEAADEFREPHVGDHREVRARVRVSTGRSAALEQHDGSPSREREQAPS